MRISTFKSDRGYRSRIDQFTVSFEGRPVNIFDVMLADDAESILVTIKRYPGGGVVYVNDETVTVIQRGTVKIGRVSNVVIRQPEEVPFE